MPKLLILHRSEASYLVGEIGSGSNLRAKSALQYLAKELRSGRGISGADKSQLQTAALGALHSGSSDEKVRRWALNVLMIIGTRDACLEPIKRVLNHCSKEPQVVASAIAAIFKLDPNGAYAYLRQNDSLSSNLLHLSALQSVSAKSLDLSGTRINIDVSPPEILKLALVLVGIDRAPENIFDPRYPNSQIVKVLGGHDEPIVSQYSVWAISENINLTSKHIGIDVGNLEKYADNVRSYTYRLFGAELEYSVNRHEIILQGVEDQSAEARTGLAIGLRNAYYDGLDSLVMPWWRYETDDDVRSAIVDHQISQSERSSTYRSIAMELYESENDPVKRRRMLAAAAGQALYGDFKQLDAHREYGTLFGTQKMVTNNYSIGNLNSGVTALGGDARNSGDVVQNYSIDQRKLAIEALTDAAYQLANLGSSNEVILARNAVEQARVEPTQSKLKTVVSTLTRVKEGLKETAEIGETALKLGQLISTLGTTIC